MRNVAGGELALQAKVGNGAAYVSVQEPITGAAVAATGQLPAAGAFDRIIQASLWLDDTNLILAVNGTICNFAAFDAGTLVPSAAPATVGAGTALIPAFPLAATVQVLSCGYTQFPGLNVGGNVSGFLSEAFSAAREGDGSGYIVQSGGIDWTHRYDARSLTPGRSGLLNKTSTGAVAQLPVAPTPWADLGNSGRANLALPPIAAAPLIRGGNSVLGPTIIQRKNMDWAAMGTFFFTP